MNDAAITALEGILAGLKDGRLTLDKVEHSLETAVDAGQAYRTGCQAFSIRFADAAALEQHKRRGGTVI